MVTGNTKLAHRLRDMAATLQKEIDERRRPRLENTRRRAEMAASIREDARRMEKTQAALIGLAQAHEQNRVPQVLANVTTKKQVEEIVHAYRPTITVQAQKDALLALCDPQAGQLTEADKIREMERQLVGRKIEGFYPTPRALVEVMLHYADIQPGDRVLEPSAGKGNIADMVRERHPQAQLDVIECNHSLRQILSYKGHNLIAVDCLEVCNPVYNVVVMNPPFEKLADIDHVLHAFEKLLAPGGRLVSVMSESGFFRQDKKAQGFRAWLESMGAGVIDVPAGAFHESGTEVKTRIIIVDKDGSPSPISQPEQQPEMDDTPQPQFLNSDEILEALDETQQEPNAAPTLVSLSPEEPQLSDEEIDAMAMQMAASLAANFAAVIQQAYADAQESEPDQTQERDMQKALSGFGAQDKLLRLRQNKLF